MDALLWSLAREALLLVVLASLPPLAASLAVGLLVALAQAVTQVQESTLTVVPKLGAALVALAFAGPWIASMLGRFTSRLLLLLPEVAQ
jgi:flagellar biosynthetic protein FliQ